jgi:hypothetical protein
VSPTVVQIDNSGVYAIDVTLTGLTNGGGGPNQPISIYLTANNVQIPNTLYTVYSSSQSRFNMDAHMLLQFPDVPNGLPFSTNIQISVVMTGPTLEFTNTTGFANATIRIARLAGA